VHAPAPSQPNNGRRYLLGLALGLIPVLMEWLSGLFTCSFVSSTTCSGPNSPALAGLFLGAGLVLYAAVFLGMLVSLFVESVRYVGYGLLTMVFVAPIIAVVGCTTIINAAHPV